ncbi:MAG: head GIN domain-containing protein [Thermodesulfobacteriota bacterium]
MKAKAILPLTIFLLSTTVAVAGTVIINNTVIYNDCVKGSGKNKTENRNLASFNTIELNGAFLVNIVSSRENQQFEIIGEDNIIPHIVSKVRGNELKVYADKNICPTTELVINIAAKNIKELEVVGADDVNVSAINNENFEIELSGSGDIVLEGKTNSLDVGVSGSGDIKAQDLKARKAKVEVSGAGDVSVYASDVLEVVINGAAEVRYYGNPTKLIQEISGAGELEKM